MKIVSGSLAFHGRQTIDLEDHFVTGRQSSGGQIGVLGWGLAASGGGSGSVAQVNPEPGHSGIVRLSTGTTTNSAVAFYPHLDGYQFLSNKLRVGFWVRVNQVDANTIVRVGCWTSVISGNPFANWCGWEKAAADENWFRIARESSTETEADSGISVDTDWIYLESAIIDGVAYYWADDVLIGTIADANVPEGLVGMPVAQIMTTTNANKTLDIDYCRIHQDLT